MDSKIAINYAKIDALIPYQNNARKHADADVDAIMRSIKEFGFNDPIGVWKDIIVEGHGRLIAAKRLGMEEVPTIRLDHLTDEQRKAYALAHNKTAELSGWDFDILAAELQDIANIDMSAFGFDEAAAGLEESLEVEEDDFNAEIPEVPETVWGGIYQLGNHRLICGDATDPETIRILMDGVTADLYLTDPPYNVALGQHMRPSEAKQLRRRTDGLVIDNDEWENDDDFVDFLGTCFSNAMEHMRSGAVYYIWHAGNQAGNFHRGCKKAGMEIRQTLIWSKNTFALGRQDYQWRHEHCLYGWKDGKHYFVDSRKETTVFEDALPNFKSMKKEEMQKLLEDIYSDKISTTVLHENKPAANELHPTMKPIKLMARLIQNSTKSGELVLDSFAGSGSTMIACEQLNRRCFMSELDPKYCDVIIDRWEAFTGGKAERIK